MRDNETQLTNETNQTRTRFFTEESGYGFLGSFAATFFMMLGSPVPGTDMGTVIAVDVIKAVPACMSFIAIAFACAHDRKRNKIANIGPKINILPRAANRTKAASIAIIAGSAVGFGLITALRSQQDEAVKTQFKYITAPRP